MSTTFKIRWPKRTQQKARHTEGFSRKIDETIIHTNSEKLTIFENKIQGKYLDASATALKDII